MYVARFGVLTVTETSLAVKVELVDHWITKPVSFVALSVQVKAAEVLVKVPAARLEGAAGTTVGAAGVTLLEAADAAPVPITFVAVTVNV